MKGSCFKGGFCSKAFTLIELLVVVLIIGILAAVAVPQYQKAVEKSRATQALPLLKGTYKAAVLYYMDNGKYPNRFADMGFDVPWTGKKMWRYISEGETETKSNDDWSLQVYHTSEGGLELYMGRISGKYAGAGFIVVAVDSTGTIQPGNIQCAERRKNGIAFSEKLNAGDYCVKVMGGQRVSGDSAVTYRTYNLP